MPMRRIVSLGLVLLAALPWSAALTVVGLWVWFSPASDGPMARPGVALGVGCAAFAGGQLVFLACVADRVFPRATRRMTVPVEGLMALVFVGGLMAASVGMLTDGGVA